MQNPASKLFRAASATVYCNRPRHSTLAGAAHKEESARAPRCCTDFEVCTRKHCTLNHSPFPHVPVHLARPSKSIDCTKGSQGPFQVGCFVHASSELCTLQAHTTLPHGPGPIRHLWTAPPQELCLPVNPKKGAALQQAPSTHDLFHIRGPKQLSLCARPASNPYGTLPHVNKTLLASTSCCAARWQGSMHPP